MSNVGYDLDTSGGLMPLIRALIKPPDEDCNGQKSKKTQHPYYKQPGKGHNHDSCDACGEGGDLICCDRCPASFHLVCFDPPLDENDIPAGLWQCKQCRMTAAEADKEKPPSSRSSRAQSPADKSDSDKRTRFLRNQKKSKDEKDDQEIAEKEKEKESELEKELTPMEVLVKAARIMNPTQFELPREMRVPCLFPGTDKEGTNTPSVVTVDGNGLVPLPAVTCHVCGGTCRAAPLLQCDYCPLLFHQDCLDPPLTALPTGRWMCPNHVEQYIDFNLVNSISATERVALWDQFSGPVDQHAIKIDFIRRARSAHPAHRIKVPCASRGRVVVPDMVRHHYANPPPLLPSRREYVRCRNVLKSQLPNLDPSELDSELPPHQICLNPSCPQYRGEGSCPHALKGASGTDGEDDLKAIGDKARSEEQSSSSESDTEYSAAPPALKRRRPPAPGPAPGRLPLGAGAGAGGAARELLAAADRQLSKLDKRLVRLLAWQRLQQVLTGEQCYGPWRREPLSAAAARLVAESVDRGKLAKYGFKHVALPSELLSRTERERIARSIWGMPRPPAASPPPSPGHSLSDKVVRATLCKVEPARNGLGDGLGRPIPMRLSRLTVGTDSGCDVVLQGTCRRVSRRHAVIFHDEVSQHFELINYSEWGSRVNGVMYSCALAVSDPHEVQPPAQAVRDIVRARHGHGEVSVVAPPGRPRPLCRCPPPEWGAAWEGSALLPHGALLHFGCHRYVFSDAQSSGLHAETPETLS